MTKLVEDKTNKEKLKATTKKILNELRREQEKYLETILNSGYSSIKSWDENNTPMILPKAICVAILKESINQIDGRGTAFEKQVKKEAATIHFLL